MVDIMEIVKECVAAKLEIPVDDNDIEYLDNEWHEWLFNMTKYSNLTEMVKLDLMEVKEGL